MTFFDRVGRAVRQMRRNTGKSQAEVARAAKISQGALSRIESGQMPITLEVLLRLSEALSVRPWALLALADSLEPSPWGDQLETISSVLAWAEADPAAWRYTRAVLRMARRKESRWQFLNMLVGDVPDKTMP